MLPGRLRSQLVASITDPCGHYELNLGTRTALTPDPQAAPEGFCTFRHALQAPVSGSRMFENLPVDAHAIIANSQAKFRLAEDQLGLDSLRLSVRHAVTDRLAANLIDLIAHQRRDDLRPAL